MNSDGAARPLVMNAEQVVNDFMAAIGRPDQELATFRPCGTDGE
ncbi:MAG: hypothetical protein ACI8TP_005222 [Acidimicrobiales bacterium]|jgi:hypothetical protein